MFQPRKYYGYTINKIKVNAKAYVGMPLLKYEKAQVSSMVISPSTILPRQTSLHASHLLMFRL